MIKVLKTMKKPRHSHGSAVQTNRLMERQLWRLQDLSVGGALGFTLELFFLSLKEMLSSFTSTPRENYITFYVGAFKAITSDWEEFKPSLGTQQIILNLVCDIALPNRGIFSNYRYPEYIMDELLKLLGNMIEGQANTHINAAKHELSGRVDSWEVGDKHLRDRAYEIIRGNHGPSGPS
jgi:hypothetical protein